MRRIGGDVGWRRRVSRSPWRKPERKTSSRRSRLKILVPYAPGGATDIVAASWPSRSVSRSGSHSWSRTSRRTLGILAIEEMARARPDGYTLQVGNVSTKRESRPSSSPASSKVNYARDVAPVTNLIDVPAFLVVTDDELRCEGCQGARRIRPRRIPASLRYARSALAATAL